MKLRDFALAACLLGCPLWETGQAQQAASAPLAAPAEPHPAPAAVPVGPAVYNVELIIFRTNANLGSPENWTTETAQAPTAPSGADGETAAPVSEAAPSPGAGAAQAPSGRFVRALTPADYQLADLEARIKASGSYVPVAHVGWAQTASPWGTHESMSLQQLGLDNPLLSGTVTLERGQFLHLGLALNLTIANPPAGLGAAPQTTFVLSDNHRVKFYERNYFDAPAFGVIALVVPSQGARRAGR
jgi:hypothetical protein